nr:hypothetical protein OG999_12230 [Streptomyces sp. NBC_00886]
MTDGGDARPTRQGRPGAGLLDPERVRRTDPLGQTVALFTTTRADLAFEELCAMAADERPDVIVAEMWDHVAPLVAEKLGIPWVVFAHSLLLDRRAVVTAGGSGTTPAALSRGLPLAFVPCIANQPLVASAVAGFGAGVGCDDPAKPAETVKTPLHEPEPRADARAASEWLGRRPASGAVLSTVRDRIGVSGR